MQKCAPKASGDHEVWYYYCNRAGIYQTRGTGKRQLKTQGSAKVGEQCTAHMRASKNLVSGHVDVQYCSTHHNHDTRLGHLRLPEEDRLQIAAKIQQGVTMNRILDDIRDSITTEVAREHLVTRQDIHNIKAQYNIQSVMRHKNGLTSVCAWVEEMRSLDYNPVVIFKQQGTKQSDNIDNMADNDFILGIQTVSERRNEV